ncbi:MAG: 50S ribosomal protein L11 methyltransferase [Acidobacteria bacterium]|nr:50S ribosomal protein L11 methyltransferase [Acidobacteriota bacterium]
MEFEIGAGEKDLWIAELWEHGSTGMVESDTADGGRRIRAFFGSAAGLLERFGALSPRLEVCAERDWVSVSRALWEPRLVGEKLFLVPEWRDDPAPAGRIRIGINPGLACGTGAHEATRLCLVALERYLLPGMTVLDIGTGGGILSVAASRLGAGRVIACDDDWEAVAIAAANFTRAGVAVDLLAGSVASLAARTADLVLCNIGPDAAASLAADTLRCLRPGGLCISSGFERADEARVRAAVAGQGGAILEALFENEWCALVYAAASGGDGNGPRASSSRTATSRISSSS